MDIITRAQANLPAPPSSLTRHSGSWPGITWHHTGGNYTTWRAIYNWQVLQRPVGARLPYIGYSYGIANGRVTELRGWGIRPAGDHQNSRLQVCFMGTWDSKLPPSADLAAAEEFLAWAEARNGKPLPGTLHRDVWPAGHEYDTDCPGNALGAWLKTMGDDMPITDADVARIARGVWTWDLLDGPGEQMAYKILNGVAAKPGATPAEVAAAIKAERQALVAELVPALVAALPDDGPVTVDTVEAALRRVLGGVDGATPAG